MWIRKKVCYAITRKKYYLILNHMLEHCAKCSSLYYHEWDFIKKKNRQQSKERNSYNTTHTATGEYQLLIHTWTEP